MKKGSFTMSQIAVIIIVVIALVLLILFVTGQWQKLTSMFGGIVTDTSDSITTVDIPK